MTPILKGFLSEMALEAANYNIQIQAGKGWVKESGAEQLLRDSRHMTIHHGTTGMMVRIPSSL